MKKIIFFVILTVLSFYSHTCFGENSTTINSLYSSNLSNFKIPNQDKLDDFITRLKLKRIEFNNDFKYNNFINLLLEKLNYLSSKYKNNSNYLLMVNYLISKITDIKSELEKYILESISTSKAIINTGNLSNTNAGDTNYNSGVISNTVLVNSHINQPIQNISGTILKNLFLSPSKDVVLNSFKVTADYDNIKLKDISIVGKGFQNVLNNIRLVDSNMNVIGIASIYSDNNAKFENLNSSSNLSNIINIDNTSRYYIVSDINSTTEATGVYANVNIADSHIQSGIGTVINMVGSDVIGALHDVSQNTFQVTQVESSFKNITSNALSFKVDAFGKRGITISSASVSASLGAFNTQSYNSAFIKIYTQYGDLVGSSSLNINGNEVSAIVPLTNYNVIDSNSSSTYKIVFEGLTLNSFSNESFTVRLTELTTFNGLKASDYSRNTETFPFISTK